MSTMALDTQARTILAQDTARAAMRAIQSPAYLDECEAWAQKWWGLPYAVVRRKTPEELEPQLTAWLNTLRRPEPVLYGNVEVIPFERG